MPLVLRVLLLVLAAYAGLCLLVALFQARLVYFPGPPPRVDPAALGLAHREVELTTSDGERLHGWFFPREGAAGAVLVCHGNAGSVENRLELARAFLELGWAVLLFDYRGYGLSTGRPSEAGTYLDAEAAHAHLTGVEGFAPERIVLHGESLGGGVALELALRRPCAALILESAFTSIPDMAAEVYPFLPARLLARIRYDNLAKVVRLGVPLLVVHSPQDEIVPFAHGERLLAAAREPKRLLRTGGGHNAGGFVQRAEWRAEVGAFLARTRTPAAR
ncbi:MAG TPA: alpha/beta hydrolase [Planctomycetota bacterium]